MISFNNSKYVIRQHLCARSLRPVTVIRDDYPKCLPRQKRSALGAANPLTDGGSLVFRSMSLSVSATATTIHRCQFSALVITWALVNG